jgi:hypothetical protein
MSHICVSREQLTQAQSEGLDALQILLERAQWCSDCKRVVAVFRGRTATDVRPAKKAAIK